jgi:beta-phosphoglucomutase
MNQGLYMTNKMSYYPFSAVLFDMDGVIIDNTPLHQSVWREFAKLHGLNPSEDDIRATNGRRAIDVVLSLFGSIANEQVLELAAARGELYRQYLKSSDIQPVSGVKSFLERLGALGIPRVLATSARADNVTLVLNRLQLLSYFEDIVSASDVCNGKPHPEVYLTAAKLASVQPETCLVIEDSLPGIQAAKAAGAFCLGMTTSQSEESLKEVGADWVAPDFYCLPNQLQIA